MRWYAAFRCFGKAELILKQISQKIHSEDLGRYVPRVCFEKGPKKQFFLFMAIDSAAPGEPPEALQGLLRLPALKSPFCIHGRLQPFSREEIKPMVSAEIDVHDYARTIRWVARHEDAEDPFGLIPATNQPSVQDRSEPFSHLMLWLSAVGMGTFPIFRAGCQSLSLSDSTTPASRIFRRLRLLGHVESSNDGHHWSVAPSVLAQIARYDGDIEFAFCGGRDAKLIQALKEACVVKEEGQPNGAGPALIKVCFQNEAAVETAVSELAPRYGLKAVPAAELFAQRVPDLMAWCAGLLPVEGIVPALFNLRMFDDSGFADCIFTGTGGFYEFRRADSVRGDYYLYYDAHRDKWIRGDWYGLRFLALHGRGALQEVRFDPSSGSLAVRQTERWPELYERVLVLCSGRLPTINAGWLVYSNVPKDIAKSLTEKLGIPLEGR